MQNGHLVVEDFFDGADELRAAFEDHFRHPDAHGGDHQVWNYWHVPDAYTYLRTSPAKVVPGPLVDRFVRRLNGWAVAALGLSTRQPPWLSLYVDGCGQTLHNDAAAGQLGYVFSLTRWAERAFTGGETILFRPEPYWGTERIRTSGAGVAFYDKVPARFNQLLLFDDRIVHGVEPVRGTMDPLRGRVVLHGHLRAEAVVVDGPLDAEAAGRALARAGERVGDLCRRHRPWLHGFLTVRLTVGADGRVTAVRRLCDRVLPATADDGRAEPFKEEVAAILSEVAFPPAPGPGEVTVPVLVGV